MQHNLGSPWPLLLQESAKHLIYSILGVVFSGKIVNRAFERVCNCFCKITHTLEWGIDRFCSSSLLDFFLFWGILGAGCDSGVCNFWVCLEVLYTEAAAPQGASNQLPLYTVTSRPLYKSHTSLRPRLSWWLHLPKVCLLSSSMLVLLVSA
eukprot:6104644-Amphidinium_carterae.1